MVLYKHILYAVKYNGVWKNATDIINKKRVVYSVDTTNNTLSARVADSIMSTTASYVLPVKLEDYICGTL